MRTSWILQQPGGVAATLRCMDVRRDEVRPLPDWEAPPPSSVAPGVAAAGAAWISLAAIAWLLTESVGGPGLAAAGLVLLVLAADLLTGGRRVMRNAGARTVEEGSSPRVENVFEGLMERVGPSDARLAEFPSAEPEAFVCHAGRPTVALSRGLIDAFSRTELEAVAAHCLLRLSSRGARRAELACHLRWLSPVVGTVVGLHEDVSAVAVTRYPPALASGLRRSRQARGRWAPLYMVAIHPCHTGRDHRIAALVDL
jgi:hypothetical protein